MDVRIGIQNTKELNVDLGDDADTATVQKEIEKALTGASPVLWLTDKKGRRIGIPADKVAYVEVGSDSSDHRMGFVG